MAKKPPGSKRLSKEAIKALEIEYRQKEPNAIAFSLELVRQLTEILAQGKVALAVPIEQRVKKWESLAEKLERRSLTLTSVCDLHDLVGLRAILLFHRDVDVASMLIGKRFTVLTKEDTIQRLGESQFGYASMHFVIQVPIDWLNVPTLASFSGFKAEIQVRTVAQHLWAASSHLLQYKQEESVPPPVRRSIHRVSALLETVDLEFERLLREREDYKRRVDTSSTKELLNVDSLARVLSQLLPKAHLEEPEPYADLLPDLLAFGMDTPDALRKLIKDNLDRILETDAQIVSARKSTESTMGTTAERTRMGVYFNFVGLAREALSKQFGVQWKNYNAAKYESVAVLRLPEETNAVLAKSNIRFAAELASKTEQELLGYSGLTRPLIQQIRHALSALGLSLGMDKTLAIFALADAGKQPPSP